MNKYRTLENIIRDVAQGKSQLSEKMGIISTIKKIGKKPTEAPLASEPTDKTVSPEDKIVTKDVPEPEQTMLAKALEVGSPEHHAHAQHAKRSQRKLKLIDNA
jgi:hypothetical protein